MRTAIMQPYFFPYIGYFQLINAVDKFIILDDVNYIKKGWINRNRILLNGKDYLFTIPCEKISQNKLINEVEVIKDEKAVNKFLKTINNAYSKAPYFSEVFELVEGVFKFDKVLISELAYGSITSVLNFLGIEKNIVFSSKNYSNSEFKKADRLIDICKMNNADIFINSSGGKELYDKVEFNKNGIKIYFIKNIITPYNQFENNFIPGLSIIDVLMFNTKDEIKEMLNQYELI